MKDWASPKLWCCFAVTCVIYAWLLWLGPRYALSVPVAERPILGVLGLYLGAFAAYFFAIRFALRCGSTELSTWWLIGTSVVFRVLLLPTPPFQEIDIYRYLWDGAVVAEGLDPYEYPPGRVVAGLEGPQSGDSRLAQRVDLAKKSPALGDIVREIHYAELPTPYPPVSQAVFATAAATTPGSWSAFGRLVWLKGWLTLLDMLTLLLVIDLLRTTGTPVSWALAYGWCPLVLKEVAGSGHLDVIATCLATASLSYGCRAIKGSSGWRHGLLASLLLGLGVGAKLYPIVLAPLLAAGLLKRFGWRTTAAGTLVFGLTVFATLWPMFGVSANEPMPQPLLAEGVESLPAPPGAESTEPSKTAGLAAFLNEWEMNDLLFMLVYENLRSQEGVPPERSPWFDVTPEAWNAHWQGDDAAAFKLTRVVTLVVLMVIALGLAWRSAIELDGSPESLRRWLKAAFLTLAWFWLLAPTQNPWYWCWAVPLLPWSGGRAWLAMAAVAMAYYLRFWLENAFPTPGVLGTAYDGEFFFYFVVSWLEFGPILAWLAIESVFSQPAKVSLSVAHHTE